MTNELPLTWYRRFARRLMRAAGVCVFLGAVAFPLLFQGCSGGSNQATPIDTGGPSAPIAAPAPPIEIPSILRFVGPGDLKIDVSSLAAPPAADISKASPQMVSGMDVQPFIDMGLFVENTFWTQFESAIDGINEIAIPITDPATGQIVPLKNFDNGGQPITFSAATGLLSGTHRVKIDFTDFEFDNESLAGCSGTQAALPVCVRMWIDHNDGVYRPFIAGVFDAYPYFNDDGSLATLGSGRFKLEGMTIPTADQPSVPFVIQYSYRSKTALQNAADTARSKETEYAYWLRNTSKGDFLGHLLFASEEGANLSDLKTMNLSQHSPGTGHQDAGDMQFASQYVEGDDYWAGHMVEATPTLPTFTVIGTPDDCAKRHNPQCQHPLNPNDYCIIADRTECESRGADGFNILADGIPFFALDDLVAATFTDSGLWAFPVDFPQTPTF